MARILFGIILFLSICSYGQGDGTVAGSKEVTVSAKRGEVTINKEYTMMGSVLKEYSLSVFGVFTLSSDAVSDVLKTGETLSKGKLEFVLSKDCELIDVCVIKTSQSEIVYQELKLFASELADKFKAENYHHLFRFDNELGFVSEDSCVDNITVPVILKVN